MKCDRDMCLWRSRSREDENSRTQGSVAVPYLPWKQDPRLTPLFRRDFVFVLLFKLCLYDGREDICVWGGVYVEDTG